MMKKQLAMLAIIPFLCTCVLIYMWQSASAPAITYFQEDPEAGFQGTSTAVKLVSQKREIPMTLCGKASQ